MRTPAFIITGCLIVLAAGCDDAARRQALLTKQLQQANQENTDLRQQLQNTTEENQQLKKHVDVLAALPDDVKGQNLYRLQTIKITGFTNLYDKNKDGKKETLIVYIQPSDDLGDTFKAPGTVSVQLWDLSKPPASALLAQWQVKQPELKKLWFATVLASNYRLTFDVSDVVKDAPESLTVKLAFTDHLTGRTFNEQQVIKP